jgi:uncharacterized RDD family membrane protein YckC
MIDEFAVDQNTHISTKKTVLVAGSGRRLITAFYDGLIIAVAGFFVILVLGMTLLVFGLLDSGTSEGFSILASISLVVWSMVYYVGFWTTTGQTLGKVLGGIKVIRTNGSPVSFGQALLRYLGYIVSAVVLSVGFLWIAFDGKRQGWHDKIARTYVVDSDAKFSQDEALEFVPADPGVGWIWLAVWAVMLIFVPGALFGSLWVLGPLVIRAIAATLGIAGYGE